MATKKKMLEAAAGSAGGDPLDITDVFSTQLYTGNATARSITTAIDLAGEGGMVWTKSRDNAALDHYLTDSSIGDDYYLSSNTSGVAIGSYGTSRLNFTSTGYDLGVNSGTNSNNDTFASWTFRKAPKFFDVVTYTGDGYSSTQNISHNLGSAPGMLVVKKTNGTGSWFTWHRGYGDNGYTILNQPSAKSTYSAEWNDTAPTSTQFSVGVDINTAGATYVAYLFAHNDSGDGEFGPTGDQDIIKCGSFTDNGSSTTVDLGFEPQWLLVKRTNTTGNWALIDNMRGLSDVDGTRGVLLQPTVSTAEIYSIQPARSSATGFVWKTGQISVSGDSLIYMAIRARDGNVVKEPDAATDCFSVNVSAGAAGTALTTGFPTDMQIQSKRSAPVSNVLSRNMNLMSVTIASAINSGLKQKYLKTASSAQAAYSEEGQLGQLYNNTGFSIGSVNGGASTAYYSFKRARGFFDVVAYTGNGTAAQTIGHNLGVAPEMMWVKSRSLANDWVVYHSGVAVDAETDYLKLNTTSAKADWVGAWNDTAPTSSSFTVGSTPNTNSATYIAYLFATLAGVSKVGSVTHSGTTNVDCGFSAGARFVLLKRTDATGDWYYWDSVRGIVSGNDPYLLLNSTAAEVTSTDYIDPLSSGFTITSTFTAGDYIFYAIA